MGLIILKVILIILLVRLVALQIGHLLILFNNKTTKMAVDEILKDPEKYVRYDHLDKFIDNMFWVMLIWIFIRAAFTGNVIFADK